MTGTQDNAGVQIERYNKTRVLSVAVAACLLLSTLLTQYFRVELKLEKFKITPAYEAEVFYLPDATTLRIASMGYPSFMSDLLMIRTLAYFLYHLFDDRIFSWLDIYLDRVTKLDPYNIDVYEWAMKVVQYKQMITNEVLMESNDWARRGIEYFPDNWELYMQIGFNYFFDWDFADDEEKKIVQRKAVDYFMIASSLPGSQLDPNFVTELYIRNNEKDMALFFALQKYFEASESEKEMLLKRIYYFVSKDAGEFLRMQELKWQGNFPYVSSDLFLLVGAKEDPLPPLDFAAENRFGDIWVK